MGATCDACALASGKFKRDCIIPLMQGEQVHIFKLGDVYLEESK
jgi:hypothetical protein